MRCLALAQDWNKQHGKAVFAIGTIPQRLDRRLKSERMSVARIASAPGTEEDAAELIAKARELGVTRVAMDGYHFGARYQQAIKEAGIKALFIDDYGHAEFYFADLILNQNLYADEGMYRRRNMTTQLLLGTHYALLRREFLSWSKWSRSIPPMARRLLVTLGGSDPHNTTCKVIRSLCALKVPELEVKILLGPANRHHEAVRQTVGQAPGRFEILTTEVDMAGIMAWADLAISAAGTTCWEIAFMGLPTVTVELAENQRRIAQSLAEAGISSDAGWHSDLDTGHLTETIVRLVASADERGGMSRRGRAIVDGLGARRVSQSLMDTDVEAC
jgi:UDP-2,4-diacetamido-2,4,6-trideoxy-beta-L-altropyranose hydrolase